MTAIFEIFSPIMTHHSIQDRSSSEANGERDFQEEMLLLLKDETSRSNTTPLKAAEFTLDASQPLLSDCKANQPVPGLSPIEAHAPDTAPLVLKLQPEDPSGLKPKENRPVAELTPVQTTYLGTPSPQQAEHSAKETQSNEASRLLTIAPRIELDANAGVLSFDTVTEAHTPQIMIERSAHASNADPKPAIQRLNLKEAASEHRLDTAQQFAPAGKTQKKTLIRAHTPDAQTIDLQNLTSPDQTDGPQRNAVELTKPSFVKPAFSTSQPKTTNFSLMLASIDVGWRLTTILPFALSTSEKTAFRIRVSDLFKNFGLHLSETRIQTKTKSQPSQSG